MDLMAMDIKDRFCWMRKRHAFLNNIVEPYTSLDVFTNDKEEWFALLGVDLTKEEKWCYIYMWLDYGEYEIYFVIPGEDGHLTVYVFEHIHSARRRYRRDNDLHS